MIRIRLRPALLAVVVSVTACPVSAQPDSAVGEDAITNVAFDEATGDSNSFHFEIPNPLSVAPTALKVTENAAILLEGLDVQAGAAWFPAVSEQLPEPVGRTTSLNYEILLDGEVVASGRFAKKGVPSWAEWGDWFADEGPYPHGEDVLTNEKLRMTFDLVATLEAFDTGQDDLQIDFEGRTYVWRNGWNPQNDAAWLSTPTETKRLQGSTKIVPIDIERPYEVWKEPRANRVTRAHPAELTVELWGRNTARAAYAGSRMIYRDPYVETAGPPGAIPPVSQSAPLDSEEVMKATTHTHDVPHFSGTERVLPDFDPIRVRVAFPDWDLPENQEREYSERRRLEPTIHYCDADGASNEEEPPDPPEAEDPTHGLAGPLRRGAEIPAPKIVPSDGGVAEAVARGVRAVARSLRFGLPDESRDVPSRPDGLPSFFPSFFASGDSVEIRFEYDDVFGRRFADVMSVAVPDTFDLDVPRDVALPQPRLELIEFDQELDPILSGSMNVLDLGAAPFGVMRGVPGIVVDEVIGGGNATTDANGRHQFTFPQGAVLQWVLIDPAERFLPLETHPTPPLGVHLTHHETDEGTWVDRRLNLWLTPSFVQGRLHPGSGRIDTRDGVLVSRLGAVSNVAPGEVDIAEWSPFEPEVDPWPARVRPWGASPREDLGYVPVLFALEPIDVAAKDEAHQRFLEAVVRTGGATLRVRSVDGVEHRLDVPLEAGVATTTDRTPRARVQTLRAVPNPFNPRTTLRFDLESRQPVRLDLFRVDGRHLTTLLDETRSAGRHAVVWDGHDDAGHAVASGVYFARMRTDGGISVVKLVLAR